MSDLASRILSAVPRANPISVQRMDMVGDNTAAVLFQAGFVNTAEELAASIERAYDGKVRLMNGSAHRPDSRNPDLVLAFVTLNREIRPADDEGMEGLTACTANVFRDDTEQHGIWTKVGEGESAMLIKQTDDDLEELLRGRQAYSLVTASVGVTLYEPAKVGQAIGWYDFQREGMRFGVKIGEELAFDLSSETVASIDAKAVTIVGDSRLDVATATVANDRNINETMKRTPLTRDNMFARYLQFAGTLFARNSEYLKRLRSMLEQAHGATALRG